MACIGTRGVPAGADGDGEEDTEEEEVSGVTVEPAGTVLPVVSYSCPGLGT